MSAENPDNCHRGSAEEHPGTPSKNKKSILHEKTFLVDIVDKIIRSKVEKLINIYGGKIIQTLEKNTNYLISDQTERDKHKKSSESSNCRRDIEIKNVSSSKRKNSTDLINKAKLFKIKVFSAKQFQHWLKSLLKKHRVNKTPKDQVASVMRGKVSLKIESMDQTQRPVFEFIPKWPDLADTLCKKKTKYAEEKHYSGDDRSGDDYSSDQYSTSEIGGMCELCDMPFMNYKEHINTKKHIRESQDENRFHELDELINERPLNVIFNQFTPDEKKNEYKNIVQETTSVKDCTEDTVIVIESDTDTDQNNVPCSYIENNSNILEEQRPENTERKCCPEINFSFVPQKRPSNNLQHSPVHEEINYHKKTKRKHKTYQKPSSKDIYKVEVVNSLPPNSNNDAIQSNKPPVIIRLKRIQHSDTNKHSSDDESHVSISSESDDEEISEDKIPIRRFIRVVRKPSVSNETEVLSSSMSVSKNLFSFELPELRKKPLNDGIYYPTSTRIPNFGSSIEYIHERISKIKNNNLKCTLSLGESLKIISNIESQKIGEWFYNVPKKIQDELSFDSSVLVPLTAVSKERTSEYPSKSLNSLTSSSSSVDIL